MTRSRACRRRSGFTLLELLLALGLIGVIAGSSTLLIRGVARSQAAALEVLDATGRRESLAAMLGRELESALAATEPGSAALRVIQGEEDGRARDRLEVVTSAPDAPPLRREYWIREDDEGRCSLWVGSIGPAGGRRERELEPGVELLDVRVWDGRVWWDQGWSGGLGGPPRLVEVALEYREDRGARRLELLVHPPAGRDLVALPGGPAG